MIFLERYDAYFYFNIVYNDLGKNVLHKKAQRPQGRGLTRKRLIFFRFFFYLFIICIIISIIISVCSFRTLRVQFFHTSSEIFARFECSFRSMAGEKFLLRMQ